MVTVLTGALNENDEETARSAIEEFISVSVPIVIGQCVDMKSISAPTLLCHNFISWCADITSMIVHMALLWLDGV